MTGPASRLLVEPDWLAQRLRDPQVRVFDCTLTRVPQASGASLWNSGRPGFEAAHIPGAGYLHMVDDLSDPDGPFPMALPRQEAVSQLLSDFGVSNEATIVLYGAGGQSVVHRVWWVLTASGAADVRVLDGGFERWLAGGHPTERSEPDFARSRFSGQARPEIVADREAVARAVGDPTVCLVHALTLEQFLGTGGQVYGRAGRIPGSVNVPAQCLLDPATGLFRPAPELRAIFAAAEADKAAAIIPYCGGGIAASTVFLALAIAGYGNAALYDGSLLDWAGDPGLAMVTGPVEATGDGPA